MSMLPSYALLFFSSLLLPTAPPPSIAVQPPVAVDTRPTLIKKLCGVNGSWTHYAATPQRNSVITGSGPSRLNGQLRWVRGVDGSQQPIEFAGPSSPMIYNSRLYAYAFHDLDHDKLVALNATTGAVLWQSLITATPADLGSWSSPAIDTRNNRVLIASGDQLHALHATTGALVWQTALEKTVVNASPVVTTNLFTNGTPSNRVFISDYSGFGSGGLLYCINVDPFHTVNNPYQPGEIVWVADIGATSGNTPAYANGVVYVSSAEAFIYAFDATATPPPGSMPAPLWVSENFQSASFEGFYSGVNVSGGALYAATYNFYGDGVLVKLDATTGATLWQESAVPTDSTPLVVGQRVYLTGGIFGFGQFPTLQAFQDNTTSAALLWDTYADTYDPEDPDAALLIGGWTHQPVYAGGRIYVGTVPDGFDTTAPYTDLYILNPGLAPGDSGFIIDHFVGAGSSPAIVSGWLFTIGQAGMHAFRDPCPQPWSAEISPVSIPVSWQAWPIEP
ncbi:MAG: Outer membrane protein assembly factor BamB [Phycisphaerae bacterium]|nr:Outer membrane protein assembly factor BamB [Phycisphaerae bacterium]